MKVTQDAFGQAAHILQEHRLPLPVGADDHVMETERQLDDRIKAGERSITWPHFLDHDSTVTTAEQVYHPPGKNSSRKPFRRLFDRVFLPAHCVDYCFALFEILQSWCHLLVPHCQSLVLKARRVERFAAQTNGASVGLENVRKNQNRARQGARG